MDLGPPPLSGRRAPGAFFLLGGGGANVPSNFASIPFALYQTFKLSLHGCAVYPTVS